jgi:outer membrane protein TolC
VDRLAEPGHNFVDDSRASIVLDKPLTDFGRNKAFNKAIDASREALNVRLSNDYRSARIEVMQAFFNVLVADYAYAAVDEEMTLAFLTFDDARDRMERYNEVAEVEVGRLEAAYSDALATRLKASHAQRASRLKLALALGRPDSYPDLLVEPALTKYERALPDYDDTVKAVLDTHPALTEIRLELNALNQRVEAEELSARPTLGARFRATEYQKLRSLSRDQFRAVLYLDIPLGTPRSTIGNRAKLLALTQERQAELATREYSIRRQVLEYVQQLEQLEAEITAAQAELLYRELELDKVRLQYEMEVRARIGGANKDVARALHRLAKARFDRAMVWEKLDAMKVSDIGISKEEN